MKGILERQNPGARGAVIIMMSELGSSQLPVQLPGGGWPGTSVYSKSAKYCGTRLYVNTYHTLQSGFPNDDTYLPDCAPTLFLPIPVLKNR